MNDAAFPPTATPPRRPGRLVLLGIVAALAVYLGVVLVVSLRSRTEVLPRGTPLHFCGFYIDCHLSATVDSFEITSGPGGRLRYVVHVRFANSARRATLSVLNPRAELRDEQGYRLQPIAERFIGRQVPIPKEIELGPRASVTLDLVFINMNPLIEPKLWLTEGTSFERFTEKFLLGDSDSFLHAPVLMAVK
jgi:hypothetical protein